MPSEALSNQPSIASAVDPSGYTEKILSHDAIYEGHLILVNAQVPYRFPETNRLIGVYDHKSDGYKVKDRNVQVDEDMMGPLDAMLHDFHEATGNGNVLALSGFRTYDYQKTLPRQQGQRGRGSRSIQMGGASRRQRTPHRLCHGFGSL